ncbi:YfjI family protein [Actinoplanes sp. NPDC049681]|uniref:YfjI family protein n=1 Tax=Actinoplanes sp. NPDC049681 TaxID=3363905 RepID=UPI0037B7659D
MTPRLHVVAEPSPADPATGWDTPVPLSGPADPPPFPTDVYPGWLADMVTGVARFTQTDPAMVGPIALAVLSACAGGRLEVEVKPGWREPVNVYIAVIAEPGERKSPVHGAMTAPLYAAQHTLAERARPMQAEQAALKDIAARQAEHARTLAAKASADDRDGRTAEAVAAALAAEAITVPDLPKLLADDATPEYLVSLMAANGGRMAIISDEGGIFDILAGRYSGTPNLDPYLKGHSGRPIDSGRQTRVGAYVDKPALTVGVMAQPSVLRSFGGNTDLAGRGLPARFLFALPKSLAGYRQVDTEPVPTGVADAYDRHVRELAHTFAEWEDPAVVTLTDPAQLVRITAATDLETQLRPGNTLHDMREWANKLGGTTMRLAGLLHVAHRPADAWRHPIDAVRVTDAVRLTDFFVAHYRAALHIITTDRSIDTARHVLGVLIARDLTAFTRRELHRRVQRHLPTAADVTNVLDTLTQLGWIRTSGDGRYHLHPHARQHANPGDTVTTSPTETVPAAQPA